MTPDTQHAVAADFVFDGKPVHRKAAVLANCARVRAVVPRNELPGGVPAPRLPDGAWLAPGFLDVQVNGGGDVLFNDAPPVDTIKTIASAHRRFGSTAILPTL